MEQILQNKFKDDNTYIYGFSNLEGLIDKKFSNCHYAISIIKKLDDRIIDAISDGPNLEYYYHYNEINAELANTAKEIQLELHKKNIDSIVIDPTISTVTESNSSVNISHKMVATRAGLGWIGKTDLFISKRFGPRIRLTSILINKKPEILTDPIETSKCGNCAVCVRKCPAQAANGQLWNVNIHRDSFFDVNKCRDKCAQLTKQRLNIDKRICGVCVSVCPMGKKSRRGNEN